MKSSSDFFVNMDEKKNENLSFKFSGFFKDNLNSL
jgi:hypothetical protein